MEWKKLSAGASAVLLEGARRIGKSTIVEEFAKNEYDDYMILDFARENKDVRNNFIENMDDLDSFFRYLFLMKYSCSRMQDRQLNIWWQTEDMNI